MTTLEIIALISNLLLVANCWWLLYLLHKKNLLLHEKDLLNDKLTAILDNKNKTIDLLSDTYLNKKKE